MTIWRFRNPVDIHFGSGIIDRIGTAIGARRWLLVTHPDAPLLPWRARLAELAGDPLTVIDDVEPNPSLAMLQRACAVFAGAGQVDVIVALGGGSVMDSAKFLAAGHGQYAAVLAHLNGEATPAQPALPIIAIPTTAGTGSELTKWATVWDPERGRKLSLNRDDLYPQAAFIDPLITASLPWPITLSSGLDALSHALESIWNVNANPITRDFAISAARDVLDALPRLQADPADGAAREVLARGAMRAGLAFSNTQTALAHNISYPITLHHGVPHGIACSFCLPEVMIAAIGVDAVCDQALDAIFGDLAMAPLRLRQWLDALGVPRDPQSLGLGQAEWDDVVADAFAGPRGRNFIGSLDRFPQLTLAAHGRGAQP